jgi:A/G-specific adenine glycosylase
VTSLENVSAFRRSLLHWFRDHGRDLPWRKTRDPYAILVSEFMLQQTQVATVIPYYNRWLCRFPDFGSVARASQNDVLHGWQGLGYYNRVRNLHAAAKIVQDRYRGFFPSDIPAIRKLPGVGRYTANAVAIFAFHQPVPIVETNTARLLARLFDIRASIDSAIGREKLWKSAGRLIPRRNAAGFNSALIDLGALVCLSGKPKCNVCPVKKFCRAKNPGALPIKKPKPRTKRLIERHTFVVSNGRVLLEQSSARWRRMWILPQLKLQSATDQPVHTSIFPFTHHQVTLRIFHQRPPKLANRSQRWFSVHRIESLPIPSPHRRAIVDLLSARPATRSHGRRSSER